MTREIAGVDAVRDSAERTAKIARDILAAASRAAEAALARSITSPTFALPTVAFPLNDHLQEMVRRQAQAFDDFARSIAVPDFSAQYAAVLQPMQDLIEFMARRCAELAPEKRSVLSYLALRGWHLNLDMAWWDPELAVLVAADDPAEVDEYMAGIVEQTLPDIVDRVLARYPARSRILEQAVAAFEAGQYDLVVPAVLAQTDGICAEILEVSAFGKVRGLPKPAAKVAARISEDDRASAEPFVEWALADLLPLQEASSLLVDTAVRDEMRKSDPTYGPLNRHGVIHGHDVDYGTRQNSLRAFAILGYFAGVEEILDR